MPLTSHTPDKTPDGWTGWTTDAISSGPIVRGEVVLDTLTSSTATAAWTTAITDVLAGFSVSFVYRVNAFTSLTVEVLGSGGGSDTTTLKLTPTDIELYDSSTLLASISWTPRLQGRVVWHLSELYTFVDINNTTLLVTDGLPYATFSTNLVGLTFKDMVQTTYLDKVILYRDSRETPSTP